MVEQPSSGDVVLQLTLGGSTVESSCDVSNVDDASAYHVAFCSASSLPESWFDGGGVASASDP